MVPSAFITYRSPFMKKIWAVLSAGLIAAFSIASLTEEANALSNAEVFQDRFEESSSQAPAAVSVTMSVLDFGTGTPIVGAAVSADGEDYTTNGAGEVVMQLPENTSPRVDMTMDNYRDTIFYPTVQEAPFAVELLQPSRAFLTNFGSAIGANVKADKSIVTVRILERGLEQDTPAVGAEVQLSVSYEAAFAANSSSFVGFSSGRTILANSLPIIMFWNVDIGSVEPVVTAVGYDCSLGPQSISSEADTHLSTVFYCVAVTD